MLNEFLIIILIVLIYATFPQFVHKIVWRCVWLCCLSIIVVYSVMPVNYSPTITLNKSGKFTSIEMWRKRISWLSFIDYKKYITPVFYVNGSVYDANFKLIPNYDNINELISIYGCKNLGFVKQIAMAHGDLQYVNNIYIIDNRRCRTEFILDKKIIVVDFPAGMPNVNYFFQLNKTYQLNKRFNYIDLRYKQFIIGKQK